MKPPTTHSSDRSASSEGDDVTPETVLLVDDDADLREVLRLWLADARWEVREAADGRQALDRLDGTIDVLVIDREMPVCTGPEVLDRIDETEFDGSVLVLSGCPPDERLNEADVTSYLTKPVTREEFVEQLDRIGSGRHE